MRKSQLPTRGHAITCENNQNQRKGSGWSPPGRIASGQIRFEGVDLLALSEEQM
jgi:hypothetical protein